MIVSNEQIVSLHTAKGVQLHQFLANEQMSMAWSRELRQTSQCELSVPQQFAVNQLPDIVPWVQWITVWDNDGRDVLWRGPIQGVTATRSSLSITSRDPSAYYAKTRTPLTKRWDAIDPSVPAGAMWEQMAEDKGLNIEPIVRPDPLGDRFDVSLVRDSQMMEADIDNLVQMGLRWTVVSGVPILGPLPLRSVVALSEDDFIGGGLQLQRDGTQMANDVVLRGANVISRARLPIEGQNLQAIVNIDNMFGVSNADKAVRQYVRYAGQIRDTLVVPPDSELHPDAPVSIDQLIPSARFNVEAFGLLTQMELRSVKVSITPGKASVAVSMETVNDDLPELAELQANKPGGLG